MISSSVDESFVRKTIVKTRIAHGVIMGQMRCTPVEVRGSRTPSPPQLGHGVESQRPLSHIGRRVTNPLTYWRRVSGRNSPNFLAVKIEQHVAMGDLLFGHLVG
jgi:hypothetical protein